MHSLRSGLRAAAMTLAALLIALVSFQGCASSTEDDGLSDLLILLALINLTTPPKVRFTNSSGSTETYTLHSLSSCSASSRVASINGGNAVANGVTTDYTSITAGTYYISFDGGTSCGGLHSYANGSSTTVTSTTIYSFSSP